MKGLFVLMGIIAFCWLVFGETKPRRRSKPIDWHYLKRKNRKP